MKKFIKSLIRKIRRKPREIPPFDAYYLELSYLKEMEEKEREEREAKEREGREE